MDEPRRRFQLIILLACVQRGWIVSIRIRVEDAPQRCLGQAHRTFMIRKLAIFFFIPQHRNLSLTLSKRFKSCKKEYTVKALSSSYTGPVNHVVISDGTIHSQKIFNRLDLLNVATIHDRTASRLL